MPCALLVALTIGVPALPTAFAPTAAAQSTARPSGHAQPTLPIATLQAGIHLIRAEVASTQAQRSTGLMFRESLAPNHGMMFVFPQKAGHCFWMRNTLVPLSIAFLDDDGSIVNIADMTPRSEESHCPERAVRYALEMEQGWFGRRGIGPGTRLINKQLFGSDR